MSNVLSDEKNNKFLFWEDWAGHCGGSRKPLEFAGKLRAST
jgi:hypothetical protein